jgi:hypothetical protein
VDVKHLKIQETEYLALSFLLWGRKASEDTGGGVSGTELSFVGRKAFEDTGDGVSGTELSSFVFTA